LTAMGSVPGLTLDQFSLDETDGLLRVATTNSFGDRATSGVYVLAAAAGNLQTVGSVSGLAKGERIYSVRFVGDRGYVSTFKQVDPLFVIDLANPAKPRVVGELKVPGFSSSMQPLDDTHLLGVGRDVDPDTGRVRGLQLSIFDVGDPANPTRTATYTFEGDGWASWSAALWDHHALSWFPTQGILALPVQQGSWWTGSSGLVVFKVDLAGKAGFTKLGEISHSTDVQRSIRIGEFLYSVSSSEVKVHRLTDPKAQVAAVKLAAPEPWMWYAC
ncbi:MAG: beta-propeller domain-containing protein, partial [Planctomycetia bacterium]